MCRWRYFGYGKHCRLEYTPVKGEGKLFAFGTNLLGTEPPGKNVLKKYAQDIGQVQVQRALHIRDRLDVFFVPGGLCKKIGGYFRYLRRGERFQDKFRNSVLYRFLSE